MSNPEAYITGGTVPPGGGLYVKRDADDELLVLCRMRAFVYILSTRQVGKSSLMTNVATVLAEEGVRSVIIDLSEFGVEEVTADQWYIGLLKELRGQLGLNVNVKAWWGEHAHLPYGQRLTLFLREVLLAQVAEPVVIFVDEIDTTRSLVFTDDFYSAVRSVYNARARVPAFQRLSFVLVGVATPTDLIRDPKRTPFNIGQRVELTDFTYDEALPLTGDLGLPSAEAARVLRHVLKWTNGHPYLTLRLLHDIAQQTREGKTDWQEPDVDRLVDAAFFGNEGDNNLSFVRDMLTIHAPDLEGILTTYREIYLRRRPVADEEHSVVKSHLKLSGVVRREGGLLHVRNRIYRKAFDEAWVGTHMPPNWPRRLQRAAIAALALFFIALVPLALYAWDQKTKAEGALNKAEEARREAVAQRNEAEHQKATAVQQSQIADESRKKAEVSAEVARNAKERAEKSAIAERSAKEVAVQQTQRAKKSAVAERSAKEVAVEKTLLAKAEALKANKSAEAARQAEIVAEEQSQLARAAAEEASKAREKAIEAQAREEEQRRLAEARGQVGFARQLEIQAERAWDKSDTSAAEVFFANALAFDDRTETRGRVLGAMLRGTQKLWMSRAHTVNQNIALGADGSMVAFVDDGQMIRLREVNSGAEINNIHADGVVTKMAFSPDGSRLVTVELDTSASDISSRKVKVVVYDVKTGVPSKTIDANNSVYFDGVIISRDARAIVISNSASQMTVVDVESGKVSGVTPPYSYYGSGRGMAISPDNQLFAELRSDSSINLFKIDSGQVVGELVIAENSVQPAGPAARQTQTSVVKSHEYGSLEGLTFSPDGRQVAAVFDSYGSLQRDKVIVWNVATHQEVARLPIADRIGDYLIAFSPDGLALAVWHSGTVENWDIDSGRLLSSYSLRDLVGSPKPTFSPDGRRLVLRTSPISLKVLDTRTGADARTYPLPALDGHAALVNSVVFNSDGRLLASGGADATVIVWDAESGRLLKSLLGHTSAVNSVVFSPADRKLLASGEDDGAILLWNVETGQKIGEPMRPPKPSETPQGSVPTPSPTPSNLSGRKVNSLAFSPDGRLLASGNSDWGIRLWDVEKHEMVGEVCGHEGGINSVAFSRDGKQLVSGGDDGFIRFWTVDSLLGSTRRCDLMNSKSFRQIKGHKESVFSVAFSPDGKMLASNGGDSTVKLWNVEDGVELYALPDQATYGKVVFSPDGVRLALMSTEDPSVGDVVRVWNWSTRKILTILRNSSPSLNVSGNTKVNAVAFSPDGSLFATGGGDSKVRLWRFSPVPTSARERPGVDTSSALDPGGRLFAYGSETRTGTNTFTRFIVVKDIETGQLRQLAAPEYADFSWSHMIFSPDGRLLASIGKLVKPSNNDPSGGLATAGVSTAVVRDTAVVWDVLTGHPINSHVLTSTFITSYYGHSSVFSPDGRWLAISEGAREPGSDLRASGTRGGVDDTGKDKKDKDEGQKVILWDIKTGESRNISFAAGILWSVAFNPDGEWLICGGGASGPGAPGRKTLELLNLKSGEKVTREVGLGGAVLSLTFGPADPDGKRLLALTSGNNEKNPEDPTLKLVKFPSLEPLPLFQQFTKGIPTVIFIPESAGEKLMITQSDGIFRLWNLNAAPSNEKDGLVLNADSNYYTNKFVTDRQRLLVAVNDSSLISIDLNLPRYLLKASPKEILESTQRRTSLHVTGLDKLDFPVLSQQELEQRLKDKYDFSFSLLSLPESTADEKPQGAAGGREGSQAPRP
jgi:WD40 repeat protein